MISSNYQLRRYKTMTGVVLHMITNMALATVIVAVHIIERGDKK